MIRELIESTPARDRAKLILAVVLPGFADAALIAILQSGIHAGEAVSGALFLAFCVALLGHMICARVCAQLFASRVEGSLYQTRVRLVEKLRAAELSGIEKIGAGEIYGRLTQATSTISTNLWSVCVMAQGLVILICVSIYIAFISVWAFLIILAFYGGGGALFVARRRRVRKIMLESANTQADLFGYLNELLQGAKELRLNSRRSDDLQADLRQMAQALGQAPRQINRILQQNFIAARICLFLLMGSLVFLLPALLGSTASSPLLAALLSSAIFLFAPLASFLRAVPEYERASLAAASLQALEQRLDRAASPAPDPNRPDAPFQHGFSRIVLADLAFAYSDPAGGSSFALGPVSLQIQRGEIVFFVGGNGSGKTTLLKALAGLYIPSSGSLLVDDIPIDDGNRQAFRENIAAIFTDFHLFKKLYGLRHRTAADVAALLEQLQIAHKTAYGDGGFTRTDLSTGQRKRIAMVVALLEDRPLYIFDEWAADQDPEFRRYYYEELLPDLKRRGKTVLAISHDDRYFHCADRVVTMDWGTVRSIEHVKPPSATPAANPDAPQESRR
jgi:putative ATP-binding cassette transporter